MLLNLKCDFRRLYQKSNARKIISRLFDILWSQGFQAVVGYRICRWLYLKHIPVVHIFIQRYIEITTGISIPPTVKIGKGLLIEHFGGIVINSTAEIGDFCTISHCVTIGNKIPGGKSPKIGNNVYICVGAKVLGDITIGNNSIIGANAVVLESVPENCVAAGVPAKIIGSTETKHKEFKYES